MMMQRFSRNLIATWALAGGMAWLAACTAGSSTPDAGSGDLAGSQPSSLTPAPGQLALRANVARQHVTNGKADPLEVSLTLANGTGGAAAPLNPLLFHVRTADGLLHPGTAMDSHWIDGTACDGNSELSGGATITCTLVFDWPAPAVPVEIRYETPGVATGVGDARTATAPLTIEPCTTCGADCTYLDRDRANCGACGKVGQSSDISCSHGAFVCANQLTACPKQPNSSTFYCADLQTDTASCGACDNALPNGAYCAGGKGMCSRAGMTPCATGCDDLQSSERNCGACGKSCADNEFCDRGSCFAKVSVKTDGVTCDATCLNLGKQCINRKSAVDYATKGSSTPCESGLWACDSGTYGTSGGYDGRCGKSVWTLATYWCACD